MLRLGGHRVIPCVGIGVQTRQCHQKRLGSIGIAILHQRAAHHQIQAGLQRRLAAGKGKRTLPIGKAAVQRFQGVPIRIGGQRFRQHFPRLRAQAVHPNGIGAEIAREREARALIHAGDIIQIKLRAGYGRLIVRIGNRQAHVRIRINRAGRKRLHGQQRHAKQKEDHLAAYFRHFSFPRSLSFCSPTT